ncbi:MAG: acetyl-coenzyme A synthetase, partial [Luminiphilus sp.]|nr:acetyl-coenzyme A synthetase [Luminiphilus sp.]
MSNPVTYPIPSSFADASITPDKYQQMYRQSLDDPDTFWSEQADEFLSWDTRWHTVCDSDMHTGYARWFDGGELNASVNCIDRHLPARAQQTAILWEGDDPNESRHITYQELKDEVCQLANVMRDRGVQ